MKLLLMVILAMVIYGMAHKKSKCAKQKDLREVKNNVNQVQKSVSAALVNTNKTTDGMIEIWEKLEDIMAELKNDNKSCGNILSEVMNVNKNMLTKLAVVENTLETLLHHAISCTTCTTNTTENPCDHVENSDVERAGNCTQLRGGGFHDTEECRDKCELIPECKLWITNTTPLCSHFGGPDCHDSKPKKSFNSKYFFGFSNCLGTPCDHVENSDVKRAENCKWISGGGFHDTEECRDKCESIPECKLWITDTSPECSHFGGPDCHDSKPKKSSNSKHFFGFSNCLGLSKDPVNLN